MDNLTRDVIRAKALGYGSHYGKYKADNFDNPSDVPKNEAKPPRTKNCLYCGIEFEIGERRANAKYCSEYCYSNANAERLFQRARKRKGISGDEIRTCPYCKKEFRLGSLHASRKYCSDECKVKANRQQYYERKKRNAETMGE